MSGISEPRDQRSADPTLVGFEGWVLLSRDAVPDPWKARGVPLVLVPLLHDEARQVTSLARKRPNLDADRLALLQLVMSGLSIDAMARELKVSRRTVERRLSGLRQRFGVDTTAQLVARAHEGW